METKGITCKIPLDLHNRVSEEIRETESTISKFIEMVIMEHYEKGAVKVMEKGRTLAFQVSEELFQRVKEYLENYEKTYHRRLTQKEFVISLIEQALEEAEEEFEAARAAQEEARANRFNPLTGSFYGEADDICPLFLHLRDGWAGSEAGRGDRLRWHHRQFHRKPSALRGVAEWGTHRRPRIF